MSFLFKKPDQPEQVELANIKNEKVASNQSIRPLPFGWGTFSLGGTFIADLISPRSEEVKVKVKTGKSSSEDRTVAYDYYASLAHAICVGEVDQITSIKLNDDEHWTGPVNNAGTDLPGSLTTALGKLYFYWGSKDQKGRTSSINYDSVLGSSHPAYRWTCWALAEDFYFGQVNNPPNLHYTLKRIPQVLTLTRHESTVGSEGLAGDAVPAEIIYDILTHPMGLNLPASKLNKSSFESCGEDHISNGIFISPVLTTTMSIRSFIAKIGEIAHCTILEDSDGTYYLKNMKSSDTAITIQQGWHKEDPKIKMGTWAELYSEVRVNYSDPDEDNDGMPVGYYDPAIVDLVGGNNPKDFDRKWIRNINLAYKEAQGIGRLGSRPKREYEFSFLRNDTTKAIKPWDVLAITHDKVALSSDRMRVIDVNFAGPKNLGIKVICERDRINIIEGIADPAAEDSRPTANLDPDDATVRLGTVPPLLMSPFYDGFVVFAARPNNQTNAAIVEFAWDTSGDWSQVAIMSGFPVIVKIRSWEVISDSNVILDIEVISSNPSDADDDHQKNTFLSMINDAVRPELYLITGRYRKYDTNVFIREQSQAWGSSYVDVSSNEITLSNTTGVSVGDIVTFSLNSSGTWDGPVPLSPFSQYYIVSLIGSEIKVSSTSGGSAITLYDAGSGSDYTVKIYDGTLSAETVEHDDQMWNMVKPDSTIDAVDSEDIVFTTVDTTNNEIDLSGRTAESDINDLELDDQVEFIGTDLPAPLAASTIYYIRAIDTTNDEIKVGATKGGAVINLTDAGSGTRTIRLLKTDRWKLRCTTGMFGTELMQDYDSGVQDGNYPSLYGFFGAMSSFPMVRSNVIRFARLQGNSPTDVNYVRTVKVRTRSMLAGAEFQTNADAASASYDRKADVGDRFTPDWGGLAYVTAVLATETEDSSTNDSNNISGNTIPDPTDELYDPPYYDTYYNLP